MCELKLKTKFREGDSVHLIPTTYLKYFEDHGAMDGRIKQVLTSVHSEYVPEYVVETEHGLLNVPEYSMSLKRKGRNNNHPLQSQTKTNATKKYCFFRWGAI
ncbi:hypothetical protein SOP64_00865 [Weissella confusa]|uniref:hypothetical protein n=1 Tax=Weissella confusa TaxID=1583 RepID=UPI002A76216D|nr:hypothetical protein [Weissella confusa]MDY2521312.1 hypothetical protein [Weissella confusa]